MADLQFEDTAGAFCRDNHVAIKGADHGPLNGLSFGAKDVFDIAGSRTGFGNPTWLATHELAEETAVAVQRMLDAGADLVGKNNSDELTYSLTGENVHYGTPLNTRAPDRIPGGSSNGSAAAVAAGLVDFSLGTDCGGSVRLPASYCGILGMRPSVDHVPTHGVMRFGPPFDVVGWFARDARILDKVGRELLADHSEPAPPRRILCVTEAFANIDSEVVEALAPAIKQIAAHVGSVEDITVAPEGLDEWFEIFRVIQAASIWSNLGTWVTGTKPDLGPGIKERFEMASAIRDADAMAARKRMNDIQRHLAELIKPGDILCLPTSPRVAPLKNSPVDDIEIRYRQEAMQLLCISGLGGLPQLSLPLAELGGLPLGLSIVSGQGADLQLLQLARELLPDAV